MSERAATWPLDGPTGRTHVGGGMGDHLQAGGNRIRPAGPGQRDLGVDGRRSGGRTGGSSTVAREVWRGHVYGRVVTAVSLLSVVAVFIIWRFLTGGS